jgi:N-acetylneuraminic acid mutarotase
MKTKRTIPLATLLMKKQTTPNIKAHLVRGAFYLTLLSTGALLGFFRPETPAKNSQRTLTFKERMIYQRTIEEVYWRHRIWPRGRGERPDPKPALDAVMSQAQLEEKVATYLYNSQALGDDWHWSISAEQLQAEMDRMARHTKQPEVLRELFRALGNDPFVIAECLARPALAERLFKSAVTSQDLRRVVSQPINSRKIDRLPFGNYTLPQIPTALNAEGTCADIWAATGTVNAPVARHSHTAVWTGSEMIFWGGEAASGYLNSGSRYNPTTDSWTAISTSGAPAARSQHTAVWTGSEMIVWGGVGNGPTYVNTGGRYNPSTNSWTALSTTNAPAGRFRHTAVWTGTEMIIWGGSNPSALFNTGGRYNPVTNSWMMTSTTNAPTPRTNHTAVWTGTKMIVWGGIDGAIYNTGAKYDPGTDSWTATSVTNAPTARWLHTAVWTGSQMLVWGGRDFNFLYPNTGGRYNPGTDSWTATNTNNAPIGREDHTAVWTGSEMIVWGGGAGVNWFNTGGRYEPDTDSWSSTSTTNAPSARILHTSIWTGSEMIVWGGFLPGGTDFNTGGRYCAQSLPTPSPTPTTTPTTIVTNTNDSGPGSLRQALADAHDGDTINFDPSLNGQTITLTSAELVIDKNITINGPGPDLLTVERFPPTQFSVFHVMPSHTVTIEGLHITGGGGNFGPPGGGVRNDHANLTISNCSLTANGTTSGGAILSDGSGGGATLAVLNSTISGNYASSAGGGIYNDANNGGTATVSLMNCTVSSNIAAYSDIGFAAGDGGGIYNSGGTLTITNCVVSNNVAGVTDPFPAGTGGGISSYGTLMITNSTIRDNQGYVAGGGIVGGGAVIIINSTISGNASTGQHDGQPWGRGGGISGSVTLTNSTLSGNYANLSTGGIEGSGTIVNSTISGNNNGGISATGALEIANTVLNAGASGPNISNHGGTVISHGYNVCSDNGGGFLNSPGDQINTNPILGPLQDNGGLTFTHALLPGSPAIDAGDPNFTPPPFYDQRGSPFVRLFNSRIDIGSFEVQPPQRATPAPRPRPSRPPRP